MEFKRINENTINCIITAQDMDEQGLSVEDLIRKSDEAAAFLELILTRAAEEVDYRPKGYYQTVQMTVLPDRSVSLILSEDAGSSIAEMLKGLAARLQGFLQALSRQMQEGEQENAPEDAEAGTGSGANAKHMRTFLRRVRYLDFVFSFDSVADVTRMAKKMSVRVPIGSSLYRSPQDGRMYLHLSPAAKTEGGFQPAPLAASESTALSVPQEEAADADAFDPSGGEPFLVVDGRPVPSSRAGEDAAYATLFVHVSEFGRFVSAERRFVLHMQETMEVIIAQDALERLQAL